MATTDEQNMPFIKHLASSDKKTRTSALATLRTFLSASSATRTHLDDLKLWKGLFYSLWMCDRAVPQQNLCAELAGLLGALPSSLDDKNGGEFEAVTSWLAAFWEILAREWTAIDVLRLEKFLLLVRRVLGASLEWAAPTSTATHRTKAKKGGNGRQEALLAVLRDWPLDPTGDLSKMPVGLRLHVLDIWVDEVEKAGFLPSPAADDEEAADDNDNADDDDKAFLTRLRALVETQLRSPSKPVRARARESLADDRLPWNRGRAGDEGEGEEEEDDGWAGFRD